MVCSTSVTAHLLRGVFALASIAAALAFGPTFWPAYLLLPVAIFLMRGCPACWLLGLFAAIANRGAPKPADEARREASVEA